MKKHLDILGLALGIFTAVIFRVVVPWNMIMSNPIQFNSVDAYYFLRLADMWPNIGYDYFINFPAGVSSTAVVWPAVIAVLSSWTGFTVSQVAAVLPAVLGVLTLVPVFFICRMLLSNQVVTGMACLVLGIMPGEFLARTQVGAADYHCAEVLLLTCIFLLVMLAFKKGLLRPVALILAFLLAGVYIALWSGGLMAFFIIGLWGFVQVVRRLHNLKLTVVIVLGIVLIASIFVMVLPETAYNLQNRMLDMFRWDIYQATAEEMPMLFTLGEPDAAVAWGYFGITFYLALMGLGLLAYRYWKGNRKIEGLFLVWCLVIFGIMLARRRFAYYGAVNVAILTGYACYVLAMLVSRVRIKQVLTMSKERVWFAAVLGLIAIVVPLARGSAAVATDDSNSMPVEWQEGITWLRERQPLIDLPDGNQLNKNKEYTFSLNAGDVKSANSTYTWQEFNPRIKEPLYYTGQITPETRGVASWWDYGYWILREGHWPVVSSPGSGQRNTVAMLLMGDEQQAAAIMESNRLKYLIIDWQMASTKLYSVIQMSYNEVDNYYYTRKINGRSYNILLPAVYKTLIFRLFYFDGQQIKASDNGIVEMKSRDPGIVNTFIGGTDPAFSPIDIDKVKDFKLVFKSNKLAKIASGVYPGLKIFEYTGN